MTIKHFHYLLLYGNAINTMAFESKDKGKSGK